MGTEVVIWFETDENGSGSSCKGTSFDLNNANFSYCLSHFNSLKEELSDAAPAYQSYTPMLCYP